MPVRVRPSWLALACAVTLWSADGSAASSRWRFDLPPAPLGEGIARIGAVAGISILTSDPALLQGNGSAVHVDGSVRSALSALLKGTRAEARPIGPSGWLIVERKRPRVTPPARHVVPTIAVSDITVIGSKRETVLSNYPASVSVIAGSALDRFGAAPDAEALSRLDPALQSTHLGPGRDKLFLRGIADSSFNGSGAALVGLYVNDLRLTYNAPNPDLRLYDVKQIEILDGPQGTLYGSGSMAGLIRITPHAPDLEKSTGDIWAGGSVTSHGAPGGDAGTIVNIPIIDGQMALRVLAYSARDGGYIDDRGRGLDDVNTTSTYGGRATLRIKVSDQWTVDLGGIDQDIRNRDAQYAERGLPALTRSSVNAQPSSNLFRSANIVMSGPVGAVRFTSTTGFVHQSLVQHFLPDDGDGDYVYRQRDDMRLLSEEMRLSSPSATRVNWVIGLSALNSRADQIRAIALDGVESSLGQARNGVTDLTAYGEGTVHLTRSVSLTAGGRLSAVRLSGMASGAEQKQDAADKLGPGGEADARRIRHEHFGVPSIALAWSHDGLLLFTRFGEGYRAGGQTASGVIERYKADRIDSLEAGVRFARPGTARLSAQLSGVLSWWYDIQADVLDANGLPITQNIGNGQVRSVSASLNWTPLQGLEAKLSATLARGHVTGYDALADGVIRTPLPNVAHDTLAASLRYAGAIDDDHRMDVGLSLNHVGHSVLGSGSMLSQIPQGGYWLVSGGVEVDSGRNGLSIDIDNLLNVTANSFAFGVPSFQYDGNNTTPLRPRTIRFGLRHHF